MGQCEETRGREKKCPNCIRPRFTARRVASYPDRADDQGEHCSCSRASYRASCMHNVGFRTAVCVTLYLGSHTTLHIYFPARSGETRSEASEKQGAPPFIAASSGVLARSAPASLARACALHLLCRDARLLPSCRDDVMAGLVLLLVSVRVCVGASGVWSVPLPQARSRMPERCICCAGLLGCCSDAGMM